MVLARRDAKKGVRGPKRKHVYFGGKSDGCVDAETPEGMDQRVNDWFVPLLR